MNSFLMQFFQPLNSNQVYTNLDFSVFISVAHLLLHCNSFAFLLIVSVVYW
jgi:hypothetical protein